MTMYRIQPAEQREIQAVLVEQGIVAAIKQYMLVTGCRLPEARISVEKMALEIQPCQAKGNASFAQ